MDTILLDTITFDYLLHSPANLSRKAADAINKAGVLFVSVASLWEMTSHIRTGKITINAPFDLYINDALATFGVSLLPVDWQALAYLTTFEIVEIKKPFERITKGGETVQGIKTELHKDPFDRMLLAHALALRVPIVSPDQLFPHYESLGLRLIW